MEGSLGPTTILRQTIPIRQLWTGRPRDGFQLRLREYRLRPPTATATENGICGSTLGI